MEHEKVASIPTKEWEDVLKTQNKRMQKMLSENKSGKMRKVSVESETFLLIEHEKREIETCSQNDTDFDWEGIGHMAKDEEDFLLQNDSDETVGEVFPSSQNVKTSKRRSESQTGKEEKTVTFPVKEWVEFKAQKMKKLKLEYNMYAVC